MLMIQLNLKHDMEYVYFLKILPKPWSLPTFIKVI